MNDQFSIFHPPSRPPEGPLAHRLRPKTFADFYGQNNIAGAESPLQKWVQDATLPSLLLWGPPGSGKTTLAELIATNAQMHIERLSAVQSGIKDIHSIAKAADLNRTLHSKKTLLFVDEIHRFNRAQQDALLPYVESGTFVLIGATTENPSFELNSALLSRMRLVRLEPLSSDALNRILRRAITLEGAEARVSETVLEWVAHSAHGDARKALTLLETLLLSGQTFDTRETVDSFLESNLMAEQPMSYDKTGEEHYNTISAFIKCVRDSDGNAAIYYLARLLNGGEDPMFIARRLIILASEDVGIADPYALVVAVAAQTAVETIGMPEARIPLAQATLYLAAAPKSNVAYRAIDRALAEVKSTGPLPVPMNLRNAPTTWMKNEGYGKGYQYAHDRPEAAKAQQHLPDGLIRRNFLEQK